MKLAVRLSTTFLFVSGLVCAQGPLMQSILPKYNSAKLNLIEAAEFMPASEYGFKLTPAQRAFGEWMDHNISMNYSLCARAEGKAANAKKPASMSKEDLVAGLKESFQYCDSVFQGMTDEKAMKLVESGGRNVLPADTMISLLINWNEHYGNLVGYLRSKGIVPPTTARASKKK
ncbi:MAG: hypothetical protein JNL98_13790 [Bryobacterales bacterium]|nr:hypothetical protein [Bryobacterales bacterium]